MINNLIYTGIIKNKKEKQRGERGELKI